MVSDMLGIFPADLALRGIDFDHAFARLEFNAQIDQVMLLIDEAERFRALLVGRSFGAWLVLNALVKRGERTRASVVLLAPVLGYGRRDGVGFIAPHAARFWRTVNRGLAIPARRIAILAAPDDDQCPLDAQFRLARQWPIERHELPGAGHEIGLRSALDEASAIIREMIDDTS
jgi:pimeloyl-ACP methyl ester carboxylesterase